MRAPNMHVSWSHFTLGAHGTLCAASVILSFLLCSMEGCMLSCHAGGGADVQHDGHQGRARCCFLAVRCMHSMLSVMND